MRLPVNGGSRISYYKYTIEVKNVHIYFVVSVILHLDANLFYLFINCLLIYIYLYHGCCGNSHGIKVIYPA